MAKQSTDHPQDVDKRRDIVIGSGVRLRRVKDIHEDLKETGLSMRALMSWIRALNIPVLYIGRHRYINPFYFQLAIYATTRPGSPDFLVPGCHPLNKGKIPARAHARTLSAAYFHKNIHTFISEIISARRHSFKRNHRGIESETAKIVDRITAQYDHIRAREAISTFKRSAMGTNMNHHAGSESSLQERDPRIRSSQQPYDVDPDVSPEHNAPIYTPKEDEYHEDD